MNILKKNLSDTSIYLSMTSPVVQTIREAMLRRSEKKSDKTCD